MARRSAAPEDPAAVSRGISRRTQSEIYRAGISGTRPRVPVDAEALEAAARKTLSPEAFAYIAFYLKQHEPSGAKLIAHTDWKLFFLSREGVERAFFEAHQSGLLEYHAAGSVTRLTFPAAILEEYAHVLAQRAH